MPDFWRGMDLCDVLADERRATADLLAGLTDEQWAHPEPVRGLDGQGRRRAPRAHAREGRSPSSWGPSSGAGGNLHRASESIVARYAARMTHDEIVRDSRDHAADRFAPPGVGCARPLHRRARAPARHRRAPRHRARPAGRALARLAGLPGQQASGRRGFVPRAALPAADLRATDLDWSHGSGPEVDRSGRRARPRPLRPVGLAGPPQRARTGIPGDLGRLNPVQWKHNSRGADRFRLGTLVPGEAGRGASDIS